MKILFLTLSDIKSVKEHNIYTDLLREFIKNGHKVYVISPIERRKGGFTHIIEGKSAVILKIKTGNIQKTNFIEKGISTLTIETKIINGIKEYFKEIKFDLVLYSTPPITFQRAVEYVKRRDNAKTYLMLKDIFPQNAVDLGMLGSTGIKGILYRYFRKKEKKLYFVSDRIGCMSQANVDYILTHNPEIPIEKVEVCPNSIDIDTKKIPKEDKINLRNKYGIPNDRIVFVYGGNLGKPQGIDFLIECLKTQESNRKVFFLIVGSGTEYRKLENYVIEEAPENVKLMQQLPKEDYESVVKSCDVGMIFLDHRFTIPNFPSRLLSYMQAGIPVLAATDPNTDIGNVIMEGEFGWWCESNKVENFTNIVDIITKENLKQKGENAYNFLCLNYRSKNVYNLIVNGKGMSFSGIETGNKRE